MKVLGEKGYTMVAVMVTVVILTLIITVISTLALADLRQGKMWRDETAAFYLAESGINDAIYRIMNKEVLEFKAYDPANPTAHPTYSSEDYAEVNPSRYNFGPGNGYMVWVEKLDATLKITSRGTSNKISKVVVQELELPEVIVFPAPPPNFPVIETNPENNEEPNYYVPAYIPPVIQISIPSGDDEGNLNVNSKDRYKGHDGEEGKDDKGNKDGKDDKDGKDEHETVISGDHFYSRITVDNNAELKIQGPATIYVAGPVTFGNGSKLIIQGDVTFVIAGDLTFDQNSELDNEDGRVHFYVGQNVTLAGENIGKEDPTKLVIYLSTEPAPSTFSVSVANNTEFVGGICAPAAMVNLSNNSEIDGAVVGWEVLFGNGKGKGNDDKPDIEYDSAMATITLPGASWSLKGWSEH